MPDLPRVIEAPQYFSVESSMARSTWDLLISKKLLKDDREDLESLKRLEELRDSGTINENELYRN